MQICFDSCIHILYICVHVYMYIYIYIYIYIYLYVYNAYTHIYIYVLCTYYILHLNMYLSVYIGEFLSAYHGIQKEEKTKYLNSQTILIEILKTSFQTRPLLFNSYYTYMDNQTDNNSTTVLDMWIIFFVSNIHQVRSKIHTLLSKKHANESLCAASIEKALEGFGIALHTVFPSVLALGTISYISLYFDMFHIHRFLLISFH
jgi:hypothetical protein